MSNNFDEAWEHYVPMPTTAQIIRAFDNAFDNVFCHSMPDLGPARDPSEARIFAIWNEVDRIANMTPPENEDK